MDSMRTLKTSLPSSSPRARLGDPPEQLLQAFRSAALSVTTLYKTAASEQSRARQAGYQEALDDLLSFLDMEHLGLGDGEGWKVRRWATERLDRGENGGSTAGHADSDDEKAEADQARSSSPALQEEGVGEEAPTETQADPDCLLATRAHTSGPAGPVPFGERHPAIGSAAFTFRSPFPLPSRFQDLDTTGHIQDTSATAQPLLPDHRATIAASSLPPSATRREALSRSSRHHRNSVSSSRMATRSLGFLGSLGMGSGYKRKIPFGDFFDVASSGSAKDIIGGVSKRGRFNREPPA